MRPGEEFPMTPREKSLTPLIFLFLLSLFIFEIIAWDWWRHGPSAQMDAIILRLTEKLVTAHPGFAQLLSLAGILGKSFCLVAAVIFTGVVLARKKDWLALPFLLIIVVLGSLLLDPVKDWFQRPRPLPHLPAARGFSFPSGNTYYSFLVYGSLVYFLWPHASKWWRKFFLFLGALAAVALVGLSRLAGCLHWLTDILGAYALASSWMLLNIMVYRKFRQKLRI